MNESAGIEAIKLGVKDYLVKGEADGRAIARSIRYALERAHLEEDLKRSEKIFRQVSENAHDVYCLMSPDLKKLLYVNPVFESIWLRPLQTVYENPLSWMDTIHEDDRAEIIEKFRKGVQTELNEEFRIVVPGSGTRCIWARTYPIYEDSGAIQSILGVVSDITDRREFEEQQLVVQKLESLGVLAGGIAHDFNNLLTAIMGNISLAMSYTTQDHRIYKLLHNAETASLRAADLTKRLITFAKGGGPVIKPVNIKTLVDDCVSLFLAGSNSAYSVELPQDLWPVMVDEGQIRQVLQNIIINAREAMPDGGNVIISAANVSSVEGLSLPENGRYTCISIKDSGPGISEELLPYIFDPYFSTKSRGTDKGTGLGLAVVFSIIAKHRGAIVAESIPGEGAVFHIYLPAAEINPDVISIKKIPVLIMDDEVLITMAAGQILVGEGYDVILTGNGIDSLDMYREAIKSENPFKLIILDLTVPGGMGGVETLRAIIEIDPDAQAIVTSGYLEDAVMSNFKEYGFIAALPKPFSRDDLLRVVSQNIKPD
jgi:PAS domain S-box-containing protein